MSITKTAQALHSQINSDIQTAAFSLTIIQYALGKEE